MPTLKGTMVDFKAGPGKGHGYLSLPKTSRGAVIVLHAWWGLNDFFKAVCDRLAQEGYTTLAPDLRQGKIAHTIDEAKAMLSSANEEETFPPVILGGLDHLMSTSKGHAFGVVGVRDGPPHASVVAPWHRRSQRTCLPGWSSCYRARPNVRVICVILTAGRSLPVCPAKQTFSVARPALRMRMRG